MKIEFVAAVDAAEILAVPVFEDRTFTAAGTALDGKANGALVRYAGAYQRDDTGDVQAVEIVTRGRYSEIDFGNAKVGDKSTTKSKVSLSYYKLTVDGEVLVEIDVLAFICTINGVDLLAAQRKAIGLA